MRYRLQQKVINRPFYFLLYFSEPWESLIAILRLFDVSQQKKRFQIKKPMVRRFQFLLNNAYLGYVCNQLGLHSSKCTRHWNCFLTVRSLLRFVVPAKNLYAECRHCERGRFYCFTQEISFGSSAGVFDSEKFSWSLRWKEWCFEWNGKDYMAKRRCSNTTFPRKFTPENPIEIREEKNNWFCVVVFSFLYFNFNRGDENKKNNM